MSNLPTNGVKKIPRRSIAIPGGQMQSMIRDSSFFEARSRGLDRQDSGSVGYHHRSHSIAVTEPSYRILDQETVDRLNEPLFSENRVVRTESSDSLVQAFPHPREVPLSIQDQHMIFEKSPDRRRSIAFAEDHTKSPVAAKKSHLSQSSHHSRRKPKGSLSKSHHKTKSLKKEASTIEILFGTSNNFEKTPLCIVSWFILTFLLSLIGLVVLTYFITNNLNYSQSKEWILDGTDLEKLSDGNTLKIQYSNLYGTLYIKEHTQGGEYIQIVREESANKNFSLSTPTPTIITVASETSLKLTGPSIWEFIKGAGRRSDWTIYVPNHFSQLDKISIYSFSGTVVIDLPTVETISQLDLDIKFDLHNIIGAAHIMNAQIETINANTWKPHLCLGQATESPDFYSCFPNLQRDLRVTTGVFCNNINFRTFNGNFFAYNVSLIPDLVDSTGTEYDIYTYNGLLHIRYSSELDPESVTLPQSISMKVLTTSYRVFTEDISLLEVPTSLLDGYEVSDSVEVYPSSSLTEKKFILEENYKVHDGVSSSGESLPLIADNRKVYLSSLVGNNIIRIFP